MPEIIEPYQIRREILTYLGNYPLHLNNIGPQALPSLVLALGNFLFWVGPKLDSLPRPHAGQPTQSVTELGREFQKIGRKLEARQVPTEMQTTLANLQNRLFQLEHRVNKQQAEKGEK